MRYLWMLMGLVYFSSVLPTAQATPLDDVLNSPHRTASASRDPYRHPKETLSFFDVRPDMTVVEIWPGAGGWYTEILAPYLRENGKFYAAQFDPASPVEFFRKSRQQFLDKLSATPSLYDKVIVTRFAPPEAIDIAPAGTADRVLTFRNVHNWYIGGGDERIQASFSAFYKALKPNGILGVVDHRLSKSMPLSAQQDSGYMSEDYVIRMAEKVGFTLLAKSEINANPADDTNHPEGVWTLPPTLRLGDKDRDHYLSIGESDRMTLKFLKK